MKPPPRNSGARPLTPRSPYPFPVGWTARHHDPLDRTARIIGRACHFRTIDEYWRVLSGEGEIWRSAPDGHGSITRLIPGVCIDIPFGRPFNTAAPETAPFVLTCTALPSWPGDDEAVIVDGPWVPRAEPEPMDQPSDSFSARLTGRPRLLKEHSRTLAHATALTLRPSSGAEPALEMLGLERRLLGCVRRARPGIVTTGSGSAYQ